MNDDDNLTPPEQSGGDIAHRVAKAGLSAVPVAGGPIAELFDALVVPPLEKRREAWREEVADGLRRLETERGLSLEDLQSNEAFISLLVQATVVAIRNHHIEKRESLRNCVVNAASNSDIDSDIQLSYVRYIDELSPSHIELLKAIDEREEPILPLQTYDEIHQLLAPHLSGNVSQAVFKMLCVELESRGLIWISQDIGDFSGIYEASAILAEQTRDDLPRILISQVGRSFLQFISLPAEGAA
jgi:hypothetical protein